MPAIRAFRNSHGTPHEQLAQLSPYVTSPEQKAALQRRIDAVEASRQP